MRHIQKTDVEMGVSIVREDDILIEYSDVESVSNI